MRYIGQIIGKQHREIVLAFQPKYTMGSSWLPPLAGEKNLQSYSEFIAFCQYLRRKALTFII
jgi:hypothetical protein